MSETDLRDADLPDLDDDLRALLERAKGIDPAPPEIKARVRDRLANLTGGGGGDGTGGTNNGGTGPTKARAGAGLLGRAGPLALSFALGVATGAGAMRASGPSAGSAIAPLASASRASASVATQAAPVPYASSVSAASAGSPASAASFASFASPSISAGVLPSAPTKRVPPISTLSPVPNARSARVAASGSSRAPSGADASGLLAERALLDAARSAIEQNDAQRALFATAKHENQFPNGILAQEREAIAVRALLLAGRTAEAESRLERFRARFPTSLLLPTMDAAVRAARDEKR